MLTAWCSLINTEEAEKSICNDKKQMSFRVPFCLIKYYIWRYGNKGHFYLTETTMQKREWGLGGGKGRRMVEGLKLLQLPLLKELPVLCSESHWSRSSICLAGCWHLMKKVHKGVKGPLQCHQQWKAITHWGNQGFAFWTVFWSLEILLIPAWCHRWRSMELSFDFLVD